MADAIGYLGMRGTGDWQTDQRPKNWRQGILKLYPNGSMPLTGILSKTKNEVTDDPEFNWWEEPFPTQSGTLQGDGVYTDAALSTAYGTGDSVSAGDTLYARVKKATANEIRVGHTVMLRRKEDTSRDKRGIVVSRSVNGDSSVIGVKLREDDAASSTNLSTANTIMVIGNANPEGAPMPDGIMYDPAKRINYTQIFRTPLRMTGTALSTKLRTTDDYKRQKMNCLEMHGIEMEKALLFNGAPFEDGNGGKPLRETGGLLWWINKYASDNVDNYMTSPDVTGSSVSWASGGKDWLDYQMEKIFKRGRKKKLGVVGQSALSAVNKLAQQYGTVNITPKERSYGLAVVEWVTPHGVIDLLTHPLFSEMPGEERSMLIVEPENIKARPLKGRDTHFKKDDRLEKGGAQGVDGIEEEYLTEIGFEYHHPETMGYLTGLGEEHP